MEGQMAPWKKQQQKIFNMVIMSNNSFRTEEYNDCTEILNKDIQEYGQPRRRINNFRSNH